MRRESAQRRQKQPLRCSWHQRLPRRENERNEPSSALNISGKHRQFRKKRAAVGDDPYVHSSIRSPLLVFEGVSVAGK